MTSQKPAAPKGAASFNAFHLPEKLMKSLSRMDFNTPTPIQAQAIPLALKGEDVLGTAQTGTGKTAAFGIPAIVHLMNDDHAMVVVMTPTRELAAQVMEAMQQMIPVQHIKTALLIGGEAIPRQLRQLDRNPRLIVGTPGRINDHLKRRSLKLANANFLVLDETDRMLDMGFGPQIETIVDAMAQERQTLLFSATLPDNITKLSKKYLNNPKRIAVGSISEPVKNIQQTTLKVSDAQKYEHLIVELEERKGSVIVFVKTKHGADRMAKKLDAEGYRAAAIHGDLQQRKRDRVIADYREKKFRILVATDVAARGLDIPHIEHVINYDMPQVPEDYIHRIGRTARAGATGAAVNFVTNADGRKWHAVQKLLGGNTDTQDVKASRGVKRSGDRERGALPKRAGKPGGGFKARGPWSPSTDALDGGNEMPQRSERKPEGKSGGATQRKHEGPKQRWSKDKKDRAKAKSANSRDYARPARDQEQREDRRERARPFGDRPRSTARDQERSGDRNRAPRSGGRDFAKPGKSRNHARPSGPKKSFGPKKHSRSR